MLCKILLSSAFKSKKVTDDDKIDKDHLVCMGLLHCTQAIDSTEKAKAFYLVIQPENMTISSAKGITASDKDMNPAI